MANFFLGTAVTAIAAAVIQSFLNHSHRSQRRTYWSCVGVAAIAGFFMAYPDWKKGLGLALFFFGAMTIAAYAYTPYIKLGRRTRTLTVQGSAPDGDGTLNTTPAARNGDPLADAYSGIISAAKLWWLIVGVVIISAGNFYAFVVGRGESWVAAIGAGLLVFLAVATGYGDASWKNSVARGQRTQFALAAVTTAGTFAVLYLLAYCAGMRLPLRRQQSMEYRAHPHHRRGDQ